MLRCMWGATNVESSGSIAFASLQSILHSCTAASLPQTIMFHAKFSYSGFSLCRCGCASSGWDQKLLHASSWFYALLLCSFYFFSLLLVSLCFVYVSIGQFEAVRWFSLTEASNEIEWWKWGSIVYKRPRDFPIVLFSLFSL